MLFETVEFARVPSEQQAKEYLASAEAAARAGAAVRRLQDEGGGPLDLVFNRLSELLFYLAHGREPLHL